jgi:ankyrin repeat protein
MNTIFALTVKAISTTTLVLMLLVFPFSSAQAYGGKHHNTNRQPSYYQDVNTRNNEGNTPLNVAIKQANYAAVRQLLQQGADPNIRNNEGNTPLNVAVKRGNAVTIVAALLQHGADPNIRDNEGNTPLNVAVKRYYGYGSVITLLLQHGADPNIRDNEGNTPLTVASHHGKINNDKNHHHNIINQLKNAGAQF